MLGIDTFFFYIFLFNILVSEKPNAVRFIYFASVFVFIFLVVLSLKKRYNIGLKDK